MTFNQTSCKSLLSDLWPNVLGQTTALEPTSCPVGLPGFVYNQEREQKEAQQFDFQL